MKYVKLFQTHSKYNEFIGGQYLRPNVSHCIQENEVHYNPIPYDYSKDYLTFVALENGTFAFFDNAVNYSLDNGKTWTELAANTNSPTVTAGNKIMWKSELTTPWPGAFSSSGRFNVQGNIMSLLYDDEFEGQTDLTGKNSIFASLFQDCEGLISAENLILPATTLTSQCYESMFYGCTSLTVAPELPATVLASSCYYNMFNSCTALTTAPSVLPATTLAISCYRNMFSYCTNLTTAPEISATTLAEYCCVEMFEYCTSLTTAPSVLPATTLARECYSKMFWECTSLTTAPVLPATTLVESCYGDMFNGCSNLNYIKCLATDISEYYCTGNWVNNVASTGTFVKNAAAITIWDDPDVANDSGIPEGWTVETTTA